MTNSQKTLILLKYFHNNKNMLIDSYNQELQNILNIGQRQLARELDNLYLNFDNIKVIKKGRKKAYKLVTPLEVLKESFKNDYTIGMLFDMAQEYMPEIYEEWNEISKSQNKPYLFFNMPYEDIKKLENSKIFTNLKNAIENSRLVSFEINDLNEENSFKNVVPIKLVFSEGNWYFSFVENNNLLIRRVQFIKNIKIENTISFDKSKFLEWFEKSYQNPFTLYNKPFKRAILLAKKEIAIYFKPNMKKFFKTQKFIKEINDEIIFSIDYTQELEILPFIQRWLPNIEIHEPKELKENLYKKMKIYMDKKN